MNLVYVYDGTVEGLFCCIYESFCRREIPTDIQPAGGQILLGEHSREIETDYDHAQKIYESLEKKIGHDCQDFVYRAFLSNIPNREELIYRFIAMGYRIGSRIFDYIADDTVRPLVNGVRGLNREAHNYTGFVRFTLYENILFSRITPKNQVLPLLSDHFADRYPDEVFLIWDRTHRMALVHQPRHPCVLTGLAEFSIPDEDQKQYEALWRCFQTAIAIEERRNPLCQMNHLPKRYWADMTEFIGDAYAYQPSRYPKAGHGESGKTSGSAILYPE